MRQVLVKVKKCRDLSRLFSQINTIFQKRRDKSRHYCLVLSYKSLVAWSEHATHNQLDEYLLRLLKHFGGQAHPTTRKWIPAFAGMTGVINFDLECLDFASYWWSLRTESGSVYVIRDHPDNISNIINNSSNWFIKPSVQGLKCGVDKHQ